MKKPIKLKAKTPPKKTNIAIKTKKKIPSIKPKVAPKKLDIKPKKSESVG